MTKQIKVSGNYLIVTDIETGIEEFTGVLNLTTYRRRKDDLISLYVDKVYKEGYYLNELLDDSNQSFADLQELLTLLRENTGE